MSSTQAYIIIFLKILNLNRIQKYITVCFIIIPQYLFNSAGEAGGIVPILQQCAYHILSPPHMCLGKHVRQSVFALIYGRITVFRLPPPPLFEKLENLHEKTYFC